MKRTTYSVLGAVCFLTAALLFSAAGRSRDEQLAAEIAPGILRFHILADSTRREDQELKLQVRSFLLDQINEDLSSLEEKEGSGQSPAAAKEETIRYIEEHSGALEAAAEQVLLDAGCSCPVKIEVTEDYFPTKYYGDIRLPCGTYQAARVTIGSGRGHNWWCVLYPRLCFVNESWAVMPESSKEELRRVLPERDYRAVLRPQLKISWKLGELFS